MKKKPRITCQRKRSTEAGLKPGHVICGDALVELQKRVAGSAQLTIADPPYFQVLPQAWDQQWPDAQAYVTGH